MFYKSYTRKVDCDWNHINILSDVVILWFALDKSTIISGLDGGVLKD